MSNFVSTSTISLSSLGTEGPKTSLVKLLKEGPLTIIFTKRNGTERSMLCTLEPSVIVPYEKKSERIKVPSDNILAVWDIEAGAWRSIIIDTISGLNGMEVIKEL